MRVKKNTILTTKVDYVFFVVFDTGLTTKEEYFYCVEYCSLYRQYKYHRNDRIVALGKSQTERSKNGRSWPMMKTLLFSCSLGYIARP